uniref:Peptidase M12B domain-containing protein n=1 Tax=Setaria digitata TaxID=48799 RepID=A0A915PKI1_9BILA
MDLNERLKYYEIIKVNRRIEKRGIFTNNLLYNKQERLTFRAFNRFFDLYLTPKRGILHTNFKCREVDGNGYEKLCTVDPDEHFEGHLHGTADSVVSVTYDHEGSLLGSIQADGEIYIFEPAKIHFKAAHPQEILAYRNSDLKPSFGTSNESFCSSMVQGKLDSALFSESVRVKRQAPLRVQKNRCTLRVVADFRFFKTIGNNSQAFSARYLINVIDRVNLLYTATDWGMDEDGRQLINMGFMIKEMIIHTSPTIDQPDHYNSDIDTKRSVKAVLDNFSRIQGSDKYCLVHLFTAQSFENGVLGLAYISSPELNTAGGICSVQNRDRFGTVYYNTALSSTKATHGGTVVSREADIVTAHELGHNWGATHDDLSLECSPPYSLGGSYVMNTFSVSGYDENNNRFSPCSRRLIGKVLSRKANICFEPEMSAFCGNGRVENDTDGFMEECDVGSLLSGSIDKCCTSDCRLKPNAICSPKNSPCCSNNCQFLPSTHVCLHENRFQCKLSSYCTGSSGECPEPGFVQDGTPCIEDGECLNGLCLTFCERPSVNKKPCMCNREAVACLRCCRSENETCEPYSYDPKYILRDGTRCIHGTCSGAVCIKEVADVVSHLWNIIENLDETNFWKFVGDNLVGIIAAVVLIIWIPASILIHRIDKARENAAMKENESRIEVVGEKSIYKYITDSYSLRDNISREPRY